MNEIPDALRKYLEENGYYDLRLIQGQICGLQRYAFTVGIVVNINDISYERRYCYPDGVGANEAYAAYTDVAIHPTGPWIKLKGDYQGKPVDLLNPDFTA